MGPIEYEQRDFSIVSPKLTIEAMRDSGYKDTDHAIAELIDNSIDADAHLIELIAVETPADPSVPYARPRISQIAVADDGIGMDIITLRRALKYGDGTRTDRQSHKIGRFGIGLPNASMSQCTRVDIWTWENGSDNALHCYLDLEEIQNGMTEVPEPKHQPVLDKWRSIAQSTLESSGTLVVWSDLDRVQWRGAQITLKRTAELCGRIYRKFITHESEAVDISLHLAEDLGAELRLKEDSVPCRPNDPLYLTSPSSTPEPFSDQPMFESFNQRSWSIPVGRLSGKVKVRCSLAKVGAINQKKASFDWPKSYLKAGDAPWGKHANRNKGVSIVRANRELELSLAWVNNYEPEERWWSVEVQFDPVLDEIFGVTNNKQHAHNFTNGAGFDWREFAFPGESPGLFQERLKETQDTREHLVEIWKWIDDQIKRMRKERKKIMKGTGTRRSRHPNTGEEVEDVATNVIRDQVARDILGTTDEAPKATDEEKIERITESAVQRQVEESTALKWAEETVHNGRRVLIKSVSLDNDFAFFDVESVNDIIEVWLNDKHLVYEHLIEAITEFQGDEDKANLSRRLERAAFTLKMMLTAWARYEDKIGARDKVRLRDVRMDWGREARDFLDVM